MKKYVCIHGHFYQPPRENPWLNAVEVQDSAYPFHDWNSRITDESYARNSASRILDGEGKIIDIVNNYSRMSFNFGPTLLQWMKKATPKVYKAILAADKESQKHFSGHGSAIAQSYNHIIMPLANVRDQKTQVIWGIKDFEYRFKRKPEGMWLSETAVSTPVLEVLAAHGIRFTILSPYQAKDVREIGEKEWKDVAGGKVDPRQPYLCTLPSGRKIYLFFYDGPVSQAIAFEGLLNNGSLFAKRLTDQLDMESKAPQIMHIATDGETYGHHHRHGEMGLTYCLHSIEENKDVKLTVYGEFLDKHPVTHEARIIEETAWSSFPHLERWSTDGGGHTGMNPGWHQKWRAPLRAAFDWLREELTPIYEKEMAFFVEDPWVLRNEYIDVVLDRSPENIEAFIHKHAGNISAASKVKFLQLLEMQHHTMLMYTSCGWFFDEVTGIETMQDILYAARAIQLTKDICGLNLEPRFIKLLEKAPSNIPEHENAGAAYKKFVKPSIVNMLRVGAHYAISSVFFDYEKLSNIYSFSVNCEQHERLEAGKYRLATGKATLQSQITWEQKDITFAVLHLGEQHLFGGVREYIDDDTFQDMQLEMSKAFQRSRVHEVIVLMDKHFGTHSYSFWHLFKDDQNKILNQVLKETMATAKGTFRKMYDDNYSILQAIKELNIAPPEPLKFASSFTVNNRLKKILSNGTVDLEEMQEVIKSIQNLSIELDLVTLNFLATHRIDEIMEAIQKTPEDINLIKQAFTFIELNHQVQLSPDLWNAQNIAFLIYRKLHQIMHIKSDQGDAAAQQWLNHYDALIDIMGIKVEEQSVNTPT